MDSWLRESPSVRPTLLSESIIGLNLLTTSTVDELAHQVNNSGATIMFLSLEHVPAFEKARPLLKRSFPDSRVILLCKASNRPAVLARYRTLEEVLAPRPGVEQRLDGSMAQTTAWLCYSSGTTGLPKGVMTSHMNMTSQVGGCAWQFTDGPGSSEQCQLHQVDAEGCHVVLPSFLPHLRSHNRSHAPHVDGHSGGRSSTF